MSRFDPVEATISTTHEAMQAGAVTATELVETYTGRIEAYDDQLSAVLQLNDAASQRATELDEAFAADGLTGPLHGIPLVLKDNHDTADLPTTAGSTALRDHSPPDDAFVVRRLREAGGIVLCKANLQELSFGVDTISSLGGATRNPYDPSRRPSGSSGGTAAAVAANLGLVGTGSDTCSSVRSPPAFTSTVGVRPTRGLVSRQGIVPLSGTQDTAGPITRTVGDAARLLSVMAGYDPADPVTARSVGRIPEAGYADAMARQSLAGARIGVVRSLFGPREPDTAGSATHDRASQVTSVLETAVETVETAGATVVDPVAIPDLDRLESARLLEYEWARDFDAYLADTDAPVGSLAEVVANGDIPPSIQRRIEAANVLDRDQPPEQDLGYLRRLRRRDKLRDEVLALLADESLDALLYPPSRVPPVEIPAHQPFDQLNCELAAHTGLPAVVVPAGFGEGLPVGVELLGRPFDEPTLLGLAEAVERHVDARRPPSRFS